MLRTSAPLIGALGLISFMFAQIKKVVDVLSSGFTTVHEFKSKMEREKSIFDMLRFYFLLKDCVDEGESLIVDAGSNPAAKVACLSAKAAAGLAAKWDHALRRQAGRLYALQSMLYAQDALSVVNPALQKKLDQALGYKMDRAVTLHSIGSTLVIRCMFPLNETPAEIANLVTTMAGERRDKINLGRIRKEVADLRASLDEYRNHIKSLATNDEIVKLSRKARKATATPNDEA